VQRAEGKALDNENEESSVRQTSTKPTSRSQHVLRYTYLGLGNLNSLHLRIILLGLGLGLLGTLILLFATTTKQAAASLLGTRLTLEEPATEVYLRSDLRRGRFVHLITAIGGKKDGLQTRGNATLVRAVVVLAVHSDIVWNDVLSKKATT
jgi:hypothetical protein